MNASMSGKSASKKIVNPLDDMVGYQLRRASIAMFDDLATVLGDMELRPTGASILLLVAANPGITQSAIGRLLEIERANMAPQAAMLTTRGWVARFASDGRSQGLRLTVQGRTVVSKVRARIAAHEQRFIAGFSEAEKAALLRALKSVWQD
jgi:DNA-binding MarR family transcriptional regulator